MSGEGVDGRQLEDGVSAFLRRAREGRLASYGE